MTSTVKVRTHERSKPSRPRKQLETTEQLWNEFVGGECVTALERELSEPLDSIDMPETDKARLRETY